MNQRRPVDDDMDTLRVLIREAHEAMKDLRALIKEAGDARDNLAAMAAVAISNGIDEAVKAGLETYAGSITKAIDDATDKVYERFDVIASTLLGENEAQKRKGEPTMLDQARLVRKVIEGADPADLTPGERDRMDTIANRVKGRGIL